MIESVKIVGLNAIRRVIDVVFGLFVGEPVAVIVVGKGFGGHGAVSAYQAVGEVIRISRPAVPVFTGDAVAGRVVFIPGERDHLAASLVGDIEQLPRLVVDIIGLGESSRDCLKDSFLGAPADCVVSQGYSYPLRVDYRRQAVQGVVGVIVFPPRRGHGGAVADDVVAVSNSVTRRVLNFGDAGQLVVEIELLPAQRGIEIGDAQHIALVLIIHTP